MPKPATAKTASEPKVSVAEIGIEQKIPTWAPAVTFDSNLPNETRATQVAVDYDQIASLLKQDKVPLYNLRDLHVHFAAYSPTFNFLPPAGSFTSKGLINSSLGQHYKDVLMQTIGSLDSDYLESKSFIVVGINDTLAGASFENTDEEEEIRSTFSHELLHFIKYLKHKDAYDDLYAAITKRGIVKTSMGIYGADKRAVNDLHDFIRSEEKLVRQKEKKLRDSGAIPQLISLALGV